MPHNIEGLAQSYTEGQMQFLQLVQDVRLQHKRLMEAQMAEQEKFMEKMVLKCQGILARTVQDYVDKEALDSLIENAAAEGGVKKVEGGEDANKEKAGQDDTQRERFHGNRSFLYANVGRDKWKRRVDSVLDHFPDYVRQSFVVRWMEALAKRMDGWITHRAKRTKRTRTWAGRVVSNPFFECLCMGIIFLNLIVSIYSTDLTMRELSDDPSRFLFILDLCFLSFYTFEVVLRVYVHRMFFFFSHDWVWNWFDAIILLLGYLDVLITVFLIQSRGRGANPVFLRLLRVIRITKAMRVLRGMRFCWELQFFFDMIRKSFMSFVWCALAAIFFNLFFSLILVQLSASQIIEGNVSDEVREEIKVTFGSVATGMLTLFQIVSGGRLWDSIWDTLRGTGDSQVVLLMVYLIVYQLGITNLVVSMYVAKGSSLMKPVEDDLNWQSREDGIRLASKIEQMIDNQSSFIPGRMTEGEFAALLQDPGMLEIMQEHAVSKQDALTLFSALLDADGSGSAEVASVVDGFTRMRGYATSLDMLTLMYEVKVSEKMKDKVADRTERKLDMLTKATSLSHMLVNSQGGRNQSRSRPEASPRSEVGTTLGDTPPKPAMQLIVPDVGGPHTMHNRALI
mmetsp:Transcript_43152/g.99433  ORF Transcript_43152/g.99433 Transcript_43152/m.99433 type:complete len:623 (-) Transcript_43152:44-1912(-)